MAWTASRRMRWCLCALCFALCIVATVVWAYGRVVMARNPVVDSVDTSKSAVTPSTSPPWPAMPQHFLAAFGGELEGLDYGEFGGHLIFREPNGNTYLVLDSDIRAIVQLPSGVVAITGLDHLGFSHGAIYRIQRLSDGLLHASPLHMLPGAPTNLRWTTQGDLVFDVMVRPKLTQKFMRMSTTRCFVLTKAAELRRQWCALIFDSGQI
jgi:hypothetical protein